MARGDIAPVVGKRVPLEDVESIFEDLRTETLLGRGALSYD